MRRLVCLSILVAALLGVCAFTNDLQGAPNKDGGKDQSGYWVVAKAQPVHPPNAPIWTIVGNYGTSAAEQQRMAADIAELRQAGLWVRTAFRR